MYVIFELCLVDGGSYDPIEAYLDLKKTRSFMGYCQREGQGKGVPRYG